MQDYDATPPMPQNAQEVLDLVGFEDEVGVDEIEQSALDANRDDFEAMERHEEAYLFDRQEGI